jgi:hypothetical protein
MNRGAADLFSKPVQPFIDERRPDILVWTLVWSGLNCEKDNSDRVAVAPQSRRRSAEPLDVSE